MKYQVMGGVPFCRDWSDEHRLHSGICPECGAYMTGTTSECMTVRNGAIGVKVVTLCSKCIDTYWHLFQLSKLVGVYE